MLAYAPRPAARSGSPRTLLLVAAGHVVVLALALTARSEFARRAGPMATDVVFVPTAPPPPPPPPPPTADPARPLEAPRSIADSPPQVVPLPAPVPVPLADGPPAAPADALVGNAVEPGPAVIPDPPRALLVRRAARFVTPADRVRPPYPAAKQQLGQSASLRLTLHIDPRGRVVAVDPAAPADPAFLDAARRHILRYWRYEPALEGDKAIASTVSVTLRFELE